MEEATYGLIMRLSANGRSNGESNPAQWTYGNQSTSFEGFDWNSSGWIDNTLKLTNGAKAVIDYKPFAADSGTNGCTVELEYRVSNAAKHE